MGLDHCLFHAHVLLRSSATFYYFVLGLHILWPGTVYERIIVSPRYLCYISCEIMNE